LHVRARKQATHQAACRKQDAGHEGDTLPAFFKPDVEWVAKQVPGVSFCRMTAKHVLGLERDPRNMSPEEISGGPMGIQVLVGEPVVLAVNRDPPGRPSLGAAGAEHRERVFEPLGA
jgi:hypothetical protein